MDKITANNLDGDLHLSQYERLHKIGIDIKRMDGALAQLLSMIPSIIYAENCMGKNKPYQWKMWRTEGSMYEWEGETHFDPGVYGMMYETFSVMPSDHPICPNAPHFEPLYGDDGEPLMWSDESPAEMCVQALEWLHSYNYLNKRNDAEQN